MQYIRRTAYDTLVDAVILRRFKILFTRQGVFFGRRGDSLVTCAGYRWIVEKEMFARLYWPYVGGE
jgi:hypothetical protein